MGDLKASRQAVGAGILTEATRFRTPDDRRPGRPPAVAAAVLQSRGHQRPGPQFPLYLLGRELQDVFPMVPLAENQTRLLRDHELQRPGRTSGSPPTTTRCPGSRRWRRTSGRRSTSCRRRRPPRSGVSGAGRSERRARRRSRRLSRGSRRRAQRRRAYELERVRGGRGASRPRWTTPSRSRASTTRGSPSVWRPSKPRSSARRRSPRASRGSLVLVAERGGGVVGWAGASPYDDAHPYYSGDRRGDPVR